MKSATVAERVAAIIGDNTGIDSEAIKPGDILDEDLSADLLDVVEISMAIEDEFEIEVDDDEFQGLRTVSDVVAYVEKILSGKG